VCRPESRFGRRGVPPRGSREFLQFLAGRQFVLMSLLDPAQPIAGIVIALVGGLLSFAGARQNA